MSTSLNSREAIASRRIGWSAPLIVLFGRPLFWLLAQAVTAAFFLVSGHPDPWRAATPWWSVYGALANLLTLALLLVFLRREHIGFFDLIGRINLRWGRDLWLAIAAYVVMAATILIPAVYVNRLIFGIDNPSIWPGLLWARELPLWGVIFSWATFITLNPLIEEAAYNGFVLARLDVLMRRRWLAPLVVGAIWSLQHSVLPFIPDWRYVLWRFAYFFLGVFAFMLLYLLIRRLPPLIAGHAPMDALALYFTLRV